MKGAYLSALTQFNVFAGGDLPMKAMRRALIESPQAAS
jgi:hypothetical protein